ncbi:MAG: hypothetical protein IKQ39_07150 [Oscillospiraceae bacterium]|nr:hypothetical protein [Oscillospiraceae bacterium]
MPKLTAGFTENEYQEMIELLYGPNNKKKPTKEDIDNHFTLYVTACQGTLYNPQAGMFLSSGKAKLNDQKQKYLNDMREHSMLKMPNDVKKAEKAAYEAKIKANQKWHRDLIQKGLMDNYKFASTSGGFLKNGKSKLKSALKAEPGSYDGFNMEAQMLYGQSKLLDGRIPDFIEQDPEYQKLKEDPAVKLMHSFYEAMSVFYFPIDQISNEKTTVQEKAFYRTLSELEIYPALDNKVNFKILQDNKHPEQKKYQKQFTQALEPLRQDQLYIKELPQINFGSIGNRRCQDYLEMPLEFEAIKNNSYQRTLYKDAIIATKSNAPYFDANTPVLAVNQYEAELKAKEAELKEKNAAEAAAYNNGTADKINNLSKTEMVEDAAELLFNLKDGGYASKTDIAGIVMALNEKPEDAEKGAQIYQKLNKHMIDREKTFYNDPDVKKVMGEKPDNIMQYRLSLSHPKLDNVDIRTAYNAIAKNIEGCRELNNGEADYPILKTFVVGLTMRSNVRLFYMPIKLDENCKGKIDSPQPVPTSGNTLDRCYEFYALKQRQQATEKWLKEEQPAQRAMLKEKADQSKVLLAEAKSIDDKYAAKRAAERSKTCENMIKAFQPLADALSDKELTKHLDNHLTKEQIKSGEIKGKYRFLRDKITELVTICQNNQQTDQERIDAMYAVKGAIETLDETLAESNIKLKSKATLFKARTKIEEAVQDCFKDEFNLKAMARLEEEAEKKAMEEHLDLNTQEILPYRTEQQEQEFVPKDMMDFAGFMMKQSYRKVEKCMHLSQDDKQNYLESREELVNAVAEQIAAAALAMGATLSGDSKLTMNAHDTTLKQYEKEQAEKQAGQPKNKEQDPDKQKKAEQRALLEAAKHRVTRDEEKEKDLAMVDLKNQAELKNTSSDAYLVSTGKLPNKTKLERDFAADVEAVKNRADFKMMMDQVIDRDSYHKMRDIALNSKQLLLELSKYTKISMIQQEKKIEADQKLKTENWLKEHPEALQPKQENDNKKGMGTAKK